MNTIKPDKINKLAKSVYPSFAFLTGMQLKIFTLLDEDKLSAKVIAKKLKVKTNHIERLLYSLVSAELLLIEGGLFSNTKDARYYLVEGKPSYMGNHVYVNPVLNFWIWGSAVNTADVIRSGKANKYDYSSTSKEELLEMFRTTMPIAMKAGKELAKKIDFNSFTTLADVSGASGGLAISLTKKYPHLEVIVPDLPSVIPVSRIILDEHNASDIGILTWDVIDSPSSMSFDVIVLRALIKVLSPEDAKQVLINMGDSINPGGIIIILGHIMDDSKITPVEEVGWYLLNLHWENEAGFEDITHNILHNGDGLIIGCKKSIDKKGN